MTTTIHRRSLLPPPHRCLLCILLLICITCGLGPSLLKAKESPGDKSECIHVKTSQVKKKDMPRIVRGVGGLEADQEAVLKPEVAGIIENIFFTEGAVVKAGEKLIQIEDTKLRQQRRASEAALKEARATRTNARRTFRRQQELFRQDLTSKDARDQAETALETAAARVERLRAELEVIKEKLQDACITAPFTGQVGERMVDVGNWVNVGTPLTTLVKIDRLQIAFSLPERYLADIKPGQTVAVITAARPEETFTGEIFFISPQVTEITRSFLVKAGVDNSDGLLKPGGYASVKVTVDIHRDTPVIPEEALIPTRTGYKVFVVKDDIARLHEVIPGLRQPGLVEITKGLRPGETIVLSGHINLHDGSRVCPVSSSDNQP